MTPDASNDFKIANKDLSDAVPIDESISVAIELAAMPAGSNPISVIIKAIRNNINPIIIKEK